MILEYSLLGRHFISAASAEYCLAHWKWRLADIQATIVVNYHQAVMV